MEEALEIDRDDEMKGEFRDCSGPQVVQRKKGHGFMNWKTPGPWNPVTCFVSLGLSVLIYKLGMTMLVISLPTVQSHCENEMR